MLLCIQVQGKNKMEYLIFSSKVYRWEWDVFVNYALMKRQIDVMHISINKLDTSNNKVTLAMVWYGMERGQKIDEARWSSSSAAPPQFHHSYTLFFRCKSFYSSLILLIRFSHIK